MAWNGSDNGKGEKVKGEGVKGTTFNFKALLAGIVVVLGVGLVAWLFLRPAASDQPPTINRQPPRNAIAEVTSAKAKPVAPAETQAVECVRVKAKVWGHSSNVPAADTNRVHKAPSGALTVVGPDGEMRTLKTVSPFKNRADAMVWAAIRPAGLPSGLRALRTRMLRQTGSDAAFIAELKKQEIEISPEDTPEIVQMKNETAETKKLLVEALEGGQSFDDIIRQLDKAAFKERMTERISQNELRELIREGDAEAVRNYVKAQNEILREKGLRELRLPPSAMEENDTTTKQEIDK